MPAGSTSSTVKALLGNGNVAAIRRIVIPPAGVIAVVELETTQAASRAMNELAYRKLGNAVIYVERAPLEIWKSDTVNTSLPVKTTESPPSMPPSSSTDHAGQSYSLFVSNLPTNAVTDDLDATFKVLPGYIFATVSKSTLPSGSDNKEGKSGGGIYGFVGFKTHEQAMAAIDATDGTIIGGRVISVAESNKNAMSLAPAAKHQSRIAGNKMVIKNLPFEVRKSELLQIVRYDRCLIFWRPSANADLQHLWQSHIAEDTAECTRQITRFCIRPLC
jgi:multiple RNA-binding domain-containing protein 1